MEHKRYIIPNFLTVLNLVCGVLAIVFLFENQPENPFLPVVFIGIAAVFDLLDGMVAKILKATSEFGKQLDSLADMVSFGVAPSIMLYKLLVMSLTFHSETSTFQIETAPLLLRVVLYSAFLIVIFSALRLARYNINNTKHTGFIGLPVPASALIVVSVWLEFHLTNSEITQAIILNTYLLVGLAIVLAFLMISRLPMLSLKFDSISYNKNRWRYYLIVGSLLLYVLFGISALILIMAYYILLSLANFLFDPMED